MGRNEELITAVRAGNIQDVENALKACADVNAPEEGGYTALMNAALFGYKDIVEFLISKGANVNAETTWGATALTRAAQEGDRVMVELLISNGADINKYATNGFVDASDFSPSVARLGLKNNGGFKWEYLRKFLAKRNKCLREEIKGQLNPLQLNQMQRKTIE